MIQNYTKFVDCMTWIALAWGGVPPNSNCPDWEDDEGEIRHFGFYSLGLIAHDVLNSLNHFWLRQSQQSQDLNAKTRIKR